MTSISFSAPSTLVEPSFWEELYRLKLNVYRLDSGHKSIHGSLSCSNGVSPEPLFLNEESFVSGKQEGDLDTNTPTRIFRATGELFNANTVSEFKDCDKKDLIENVATKIWRDIHSLAAVADPHLLFRFAVLSFADLKLYRFTYWFAWPAIIPAQPFRAQVIRKLTETAFAAGTDDSSSAASAASIAAPSFFLSDQFSGATLTLAAVSIHRALANEKLWRRSNPEGEDGEGVEGVVPVYAIRYDEQTHSWSVHTLEEAWEFRHDSNCCIVIADSGSGNAFGWPMRNLLALLAAHATCTANTSTSADTATDTQLPVGAAASADGADGGDTTTNAVNIIAMRGQLTKRVLSCRSRTQATDLVNGYTDDQIVSNDASVFVRVSIDVEEEKGEGKGDGEERKMFFEKSDASVAACSSPDLLLLPPLPRIVGWEMNERNKPGPRVADLSAVLDSNSLMTQAVDLNLRLMKWRMWPTLNTEKLASTRCLLFGAGTLGCAVARTLIGWGVRHITLVDNGRVSYSNPARQCLFEFEDCEKRSYKAHAAAVRLRKIFPGVNSVGVVATVPMPGHSISADIVSVFPKPSSSLSSSPLGEEGSPLSPSEGGRAEEERSPLLSSISGPDGGDGGEKRSEEEIVQLMDELVRTHDVCFALTDSREARWLPTVLCAAHDKILINAALGFDTFLVMRHGCCPTPTKKNIIPTTTATSISSATTTTTSASTTAAAAVTVTVTDTALAVEDSSSGGKVGGGDSVSHEQKHQHQRLGCYFCSDIVAAANSQRDRSLDQQCTVTRPGLSFISGALAVEMMVALLHSPLGHRHPAPRVVTTSSSSSSSSGTMRNTSGGDEDEEDQLATIPHQIRGSLAMFNQINPMTPNFDCCTACSAAIVNSFMERGPAFIHDVCEDPTCLETISGISKLTENIDVDLCLYSDDSDTDF